MRRGCGGQRDGRDVSMATRELQVDRSPEPNGGRQTLVKIDPNVTQSRGLGGGVVAVLPKKVLLKR